jgi:hypothetical protein
VKPPVVKPSAETDNQFNSEVLLKQKRKQPNNLALDDRDVISNAK